MEFIFYKKTSLSPSLRGVARHEAKQSYFYHCLEIASTKKSRNDAPYEHLIILIN